MQTITAIYEIMSIFGECSLVVFKWRDFIAPNFPYMLQSWLVTSAFWHNESIQERIANFFPSTTNSCITSILFSSFECRKSGKSRFFTLKEMGQFEHALNQSLL